MSDGNGLRPRPGPAPRLIEGPSAGQRSLYQQQVLDEDEYTAALSRIIGRDFFPELPHLQATNAYLDALARNDPDALSTSIRRLARIAQDKDEGRSSWSRLPSSHASTSDSASEDVRELRRQLDPTPRINLGSRGWDDTPLARTTPRSRPRRRARSAEPEQDSPPAKRQIRDDLGLDAFQRNYTSEDNAAFSSIVHAENEENRRKNAWAWEFERVQADRRIEGEVKRKAILDAAQSGWTVDGDGRRVVPSLASGSKEKETGGAWEARRLITAAAEGSASPSGAGPSRAIASASSGGTVGEGERGALVVREGAGALVKSTSEPQLAEAELPPTHPLSDALERAGLPPTALLDSEGRIVPARDLAEGSGDGRGRGQASRQALALGERRALGSDPNPGGTVEQWKYRSMNSLMFPPDAYASPYPPSSSTQTPETGKKRGPAPSISYANTRIPDEEEEPTKAPSTSYASTWVDKAVRRGSRTATIDGASEAGGADEEGDEGEAQKWDLVDEEPELEPDDLPLMTWGSLLSTPKRVEDEGPSFRFPEEKKRDTLGRKLGTAAAKSISDRAKKYAPATPKSSLRAAADRTIRGSLGKQRGSMAPPSSTPSRGNLTPAARSLLDRTTGRTPMRVRSEGGVFGKSRVGAMGWSPSPSPRR